MMGDETKIGKKSWISLEVLILAVVVAISITTTTVLQNSDIADNANSIEQLKDSFNDMNVNLANINVTLDEMLFQTKMKNQLELISMRDRWSAGCMEDHDREWLKVLQEIHPELKQSVIPDVKTIQRNNGFYPSAPLPTMP